MKYFDLIDLNIALFYTFDEADGRQEWNTGHIN